MTPVWLALAVIALFGLAAWMTAWSRRDTWARPAAVVLFICAIPVVALAGVETLGRAKPIRDIAGFPLAWELDRDREYLVLGAKLVQDVGIWIYLDMGEPEPRSYRLPWSNEAAQAIQNALDGAPQGMEGKFIVRHDGTPEGEMTAHAIPQRAAPPAKEAPDEGLTYQQ